MSYDTRCDSAPILSKADSGLVEIRWQDDKAERGIYEVSGALIVEFVKTHNELVSLKAALQGALATPGGVV